MIDGYTGEQDQDIALCIFLSPRGKSLAAMPSSARGPHGPIMCIHVRLTLVLKGGCRFGHENNRGEQICIFDDHDINEAPS